MATQLINRADLENRMGADLIRRVFDDDRDGVPDVDPVNLICLDASSTTLGWLGTTMDLDQIAAANSAATAHEVKRLALDVAEALVCRRAPEVTRRDWEPIMKYARADLKSMKLAETKLDTKTPPNPPANVGGEINLGPDETSVAGAGGWNFAKHGFGSF